MKPTKTSLRLLLLGKNNFEPTCHPAHGQRGRGGHTKHSGAANIFNNKHNTYENTT